MEFTCVRAEVTANEWREVLLVAFELGLPGLFSLEWMIDRAETGEWRGLWL